MQLLTNLFELLALLAAIFWCRQSKKFWLFIPFLLYVVVNESLASYVGTALHKKNYFLYIIYTPIELAFACRIITNLLESYKSKLAVNIMMFAGIIFCIVDAFFIQGFSRYNTYANTASSIVMIIACFIFLYNFLKAAEIVSNPTKDPSFWIIAGLLFYNFGGLIVNILYDYALAQNFKINGKKMYTVIYQFINFLYYGCYIIAFRLCYKNRKSIY